MYRSRTLRRAYDLWFGPLEGVGTGKDAPWEVVGTDDTTFSLDRPAASTGGHVAAVERFAVTGAHAS